MTDGHEKNYPIVELKQKVYPLRTWALKPLAGMMMSQKHSFLRKKTNAVNVPNLRERMDDINNNLKEYDDEYIRLKVKLIEKTRDIVLQLQRSPVPYGHVRHLLKFQGLGTIDTDDLYAKLKDEDGDKNTKDDDDEE